MTMTPSVTVIVQTSVYRNQTKNRNSKEKQRRQFPLQQKLRQANEKIGVVLMRPQRIHQRNDNGDCDKNSASDVDTDV